MTRAIVAALVAAGAVLGFGRGAIAEDSWLVTNTCRLDDCYLKWVMSVTPLEPETFRLAIVIAPWNGNDDPPVLGEPVTTHIKVSCRSDSSYVEDAHGKRLMISGRILLLPLLIALTARRGCRLDRHLQEPARVDRKRRVTALAFPRRRGHRRRTLTDIGAAAHRAARR